MDNDRRDELQRLATICGDAPVSAGWGDADGPATYLSGEELRALLDLADERDRYREALAAAKKELWRCRSDMAIMLIDDDGAITDEDDHNRLADIEKAALSCAAALEGKSND